jgi:hypothetical protein
LGTFVWAGNRLFHERTRGQWRKTSAVGRKGKLDSRSEFI